MTMTDTKYNGWANYATWRVNLEVFDGVEIDNEVDADWCEQWAEDVIFPEKPHGCNLCQDYASAFLADVNWYEIADALNEQCEVEDEDEDE